MVLLLDLPEPALRSVFYFLIHPAREEFCWLCNASLSCKTLRGILRLCTEDLLRGIFERHSFLVGTSSALVAFRRLHEPRFYFIGGTRSLRVCHQFSPVTGEFKRRCGLGFKREIDFAAVFHRGVIFCFGGVGVQRVELYDMFANTWMDAFSLPPGLCAPAAVIHKDRLYLLGGLNDWNHSRSNAIYQLVDPSFCPSPPSSSSPSSSSTSTSNPFLSLPWRWSTCLTRLSHGRSHCGVTSYGGMIWLAGGVTSGQLLSTNSVEILCTDSWTSVPGPPMIRHRNHPKLVVIDNLLYAVGGDVEDVSHAAGSIECFDVHRQAWLFVTFFPEPRRREHCAVEVYASKIFLFGGSWGNNAWKSWDYYDVRGGYWASQRDGSGTPTDGLAAGGEPDLRGLGQAALTFSHARSEEMVGTLAVRNPWAVEPS